MKEDTDAASRGARVQEDEGENVSPASTLTTGGAVASSVAVTVSAKSSSDAATAPGAVAIPGPQSLDDVRAEETDEYYSLQQQEQLQQQQRDLETEEQSTIVMVEATPVEEIIATHVVQHVDIDDFEEGASPPRSAMQPLEQQQQPGEDKDNASSQPPSPRMRKLHIGMLVTFVIVLYLMVFWFIFGVAVPDEEEVVGWSSDESDECILAVQATLFDLLRVEGLAWVQFVVASAVIGVDLYKVMDVVQDNYCTSAEHPQRPKANFALLLVAFVLNCLWLLTAFGLVFLVKIDSLTEPTFTWQEDCQDDQVPKVGDLQSYFVATSISLPFLVFLIVSRGRLIFSKTSCDHIAVFWRNFWFVFKILLDTALFALQSVTLVSMMIPFVEELEEVVAIWF